MAINPSCSVDGDQCSEPGKRIILGMCTKHYRRFKLHGDPLLGAQVPAAMSCTVADANCSKPGGTIIAGLCIKHYRQRDKTGDPLVGWPEPKSTTCRIDDADCYKGVGSLSLGLCRNHYMRLRRHGDPLGKAEPRDRRVECDINNADCTDGVIIRGFCPLHYDRWRRKGDPLWQPQARPTECKVGNEHCSAPGSLTRGLCNHHYRLWKLTGDAASERPSKPTICSINDENCSKPGGQLVKGLCLRHYGRLQRNGDPTAGRAADGVPLSFIDVAVAFESDECLEWPYATDGNGYGVVHFDGRQWRATRLVLQRVTGEHPDPKLFEAAHAPGICHNTRCINPRHIRWATKAENSADRVIDKTDNRGERNHWNILTEQQVRSIRADPRINRRGGMAELAAEYGVTRGAISSIKYRHSWKHVA